MKRILAVVLSLVLILSLCMSGLAEGGPGMGQPPQGGPGASMGNPPDGMGGPGGMTEGDVAGTGNATNTSGLIDVEGETVSTDDSLAGAIENADGTIAISGISYESGDYGDTLLSASDSDVALIGANIRLDVDEAVSGNESAGTAAYVDSGTLTISDSTIEVGGAGRYTVAATGTATMVVEDSVIVAGGDAGASGNTAAVSEPASNAGLLISGNSRANFSVGQTHTFYYDSLCVADGWAALSTDSATGSGLEFVGVNTEALALHGGYGIYADTNCRDYLYGATLVSAEVGAILSNNGAITVGSSGDAETATTQDGHSALEYRDGEIGEDMRTTIIAGRNDFQLHSPDMMGEGNSDYTASLSLSHATLIIDDAINNEGYWSIGQVANLVNDNGANAVNVTLTDDAVWNVTGTSMISSLTIEGGAYVLVPEGVTLTVGGVEYTNCTLTEQDL